MNDELTIVGDPHARPDNLETKIKPLTQIVEDLGNDVVWLGDMLDTKEIVRGSCLNFWYNYFKNSKLNHVVLVGNHDWFNLDCKAHSLEPLKALLNVQIIDKPTVIGSYGFLPFYPTNESFLKALKQVLKTEVVFIHQGINGFDYGNGHRETHGIDPEFLRGVNPLLISGHFHSYQRDDKLIYLGSPFTHAFGETNPYTKYVGTYSGTVLQLHETKFPRHVTGTINADAPTTKGYTLEQQIEALLEMMFSSNDHVRAIVEGSKENVTLYSKTIKAFMPGIKVVENPKINARTLVIDEKDSNMVKFKKWATDVKKLDKEVLKRGLDILQGL